METIEVMETIAVGIWNFEVLLFNGMCMDLDWALWLFIDIENIKISILKVCVVFAVCLWCHDAVCVICDVRGCLICFALFWHSLPARRPL